MKRALYVLLLLLAGTSGVWAQNGPYALLGDSTSLLTASYGISHASGNAKVIVAYGKVTYTDSMGHILFTRNLKPWENLRWLSVDPLADQFPSWSPYNFVNNNPIRMIDPTGLAPMDWAENPNGAIYWDENATSQETTKEGDRYLGKAVVVFEGSESEILGKGDNLFGEGANLAKATVYGPNGSDDIKEYGAFTMSSDPSKYGTVADGEYTVNYDKVGKSGALKSNWAVEGRGKIPARGGINPAFPSRSPAYLDGVFIHRSNNNGYAGGEVSKGCPLICPSLNNPGNGWDEFNQQLQGVSQFKMILNRDE